MHGAFCYPFAFVMALYLTKCILVSVSPCNMAKNKDTISPEQAHDELQKILGFRYADDAAFQRANYCMRVLGCPISDTGKYRVNEAQDGDSALELWDGYEFEREKLAELHADWLEMQDDD